MAVIDVVLLGRSGCGKGTQARQLANRFGLATISPGDRFRELAATPSWTGQRIKSIIDAGGLPPYWLGAHLWLAELIEKITPDQGVIFDGTPRRLEEAKLIDEILSWYERTNVRVFLLDISREEARRRLAGRRICEGCATMSGPAADAAAEQRCLQCGGRLVNRPDDTPEAIEKRLDWFDADIMPLVHYYETQGRLTRVSGERPIEVVAEELAQAVAAHLT
ncbi:nucleoside monophosphate kinase [Candidatus Parcubacteria bacterium]|nr:nucleoside monophosphate kinase [Candidatus Parcubacteria bacterium]